MKKFFLGMAALALVLTSCDKNEEAISQEQESVDMSDFSLYTDIAVTGEAKPSADGNLKNCFSMANLNRLLDDTPGLYKKMYDVEYQTRVKQVGKGKPGSGGGEEPTPPDDNLGVITIPVYVHVVYSNSNENISDAQIASQMSVLNQDFRKTNADSNSIPSEFAGLAADTEVQFNLINTFRHVNSKTSWGTNDQVKSTYPPVTPQTHLNIWVCNIGGGILGYAQFPGGPAATDGIVVGPNYFGTTGYVSSPFDKGRTTTHEIGHYLNLRHIWGDGRCQQDDYVADTPSSDGPNYGCPSYPTVNCRSTDMTMNYMDYTNDACMSMFSKGQKSRLRTIFTAGGPRAAMAN
ncbi:zinc metalloprotease [Gelidibacter salicanalis]|uniref:Zinc metalloprotease n=1 Tax=Gelidibacter salicanalis TaxID=291193 RepID=A0A934KI78_9FLAO|nr:zinc metalloprotease [Gelidibacter salicanalis]MBJ7879457.1 zinc metalloprotease [Gelidibacter salicanalis]